MKKHFSCSDKIIYFWHFDMDVEPVQQRTENFGAVTPDLVRRAGAGTVFLVAENPQGQGFMEATNLTTPHT
jgi:hypothetical protein